MSESHILGFDSSAPGGLLECNLVDGAPTGLEACSQELGQSETSSFRLDNRVSNCLKVWRFI